MDDILQEMAEDSTRQATDVPSDEDLQTVSQLANRQLELEQLVVEQEDALAELKKQLTQVRELDLPSALEAFGMLSLTLLDKTKIVVKEEVYAGITDENKPAAFEWLEATQNDGIIKNEVKSSFGKGQDAEARVLVDLLTEKGYTFTNARSVHPQTLKAFVRRQLEEGMPVPTDIFSIHIKKVASIELPRKR